MWAVCAVLAYAAVLAVADRQWTAALAQALAAGSFAAAVACAYVGFTATHRSVRSLAVYLDTGWWAYAPVQPRLRSLTLAVAGMLVAAAFALILLVSIAALGIAADAAAVLVTPAATMVTGLITGGVTGTAAAARPTGRTAPRAGIRAPVLSQSLPDTGALPHLIDWQRRLALTRWRQRGNAWWLAAVLLVIPNGTGVISVLGLMLLVGSAAWLGVVARAAADVAREAASLLQATPAPRRLLARRALRYPLFATACAASIAAPGSWLLGIGVGGFLGWFAGALVLCLPAAPVLARGFIDTKERP